MFKNNFLVLSLLLLVLFFLGIYYFLNLNFKTKVFPQTNEQTPSDKPTITPQSNNTPSTTATKIIEPSVQQAIQCQSNEQCGGDSFCFEKTCQPQNYCRANTDCVIIGNLCQDICQGGDCDQAAQCAVVSKLNLGPPCLKGGYFACRPPNKIGCVNNECRSL